MEHRSNFNDEQLGLRTFHLRREAAVEKAMEKLRTGLGSRFHELTNHEIELLKWALGEIWTMVAFYDWDHLKFSILTIDDVRRIIDTAKEVVDGKKLGTQAFSEVYEFLKEKAATES